MAFYRSKSGAIYIRPIKTDGTVKSLACAGSTELSISAEIEDFSCIGEEAKHKENMGYDWTASIDGKAKFEDEAQVAMFDSVTTGTKVELTIFPDATEGNLIGFQGAAIIDSLNFSVSAPGLWEFSASFTGDGKLAKVTVLPTNPAAPAAEQGA